ncbi:MAG: Panacea domain-containing protein [Leptolyngbyaceae cyanobacterium]
MYYAQAWHLALFEQPLFNEDFEAWIHGPVVPELYHYYKKFGWRPIDEAADPQLPDEIRDFLSEVVEEYFACDAYELEQMTHLEDPWNRARGGLPPDVPSNQVILKEWMQEYYAARVEEED